jgi:hypothetical protein
MKNFLLITICIACGLLLICAEGTSARGGDKAKAALENHINIVKSRHPQKYQEMLDAAGGKIVDCLSCHKDLFKDTRKSRTPRRR